MSSWLGTSIKFGVSNWWKVAALVGIPAAAVGGTILGTQTAPPKQTINTQPGGITYIPSNQVGSASTDPMGSLMGMLPMVMMMMLLPKMLSSTSGND